MKKKKRNEKFTIEKSLEFGSASSSLYSENLFAVAGENVWLTNPVAFCRRESKKCHKSSANFLFDVNIYAL